MFKGSTKIQSGKVDLKARDAWAECCDADAAKALALSIAVHAFEGGAWVVEFETPPPPFVPVPENADGGQRPGLRASDQHFAAVSPALVAAACHSVPSSQRSQCAGDLAAAIAAGAA